MSIFSKGTGVRRTAAIGVIVVSVAAWYGWNQDVSRQEDVQEVALLPQTQQATPQETAVAEPAPAATQPEPAPTPAASVPETAEAVDPVETEVSAARAAPAFDEVRREADGMTVIAGQAAPEAMVRILLDGVEITSARADTAGKFATLTLIAPDGEGHILTLEQEVEGDVMASDNEIILAPLDPPVVVAEAQAAETVQPPEPAASEPQAEEPETQPAQAPAAEPQQTGTPQTSVADNADTAPEQPVSDAAQVAQVEPDQPSNQTPQAAAQVPADAPTAQATVPQTAEGDAPDEAPVTQTAEIAPVQPETDAGASPATETVAPQSPTTDTAEDTSPAPEAPQTQAAEATPEPAEPSQQVAVLRTTDEGVELLGTEPPEIMDTVALDIISYSDTGDVQLSGRAQTDSSSVRVYLDNTAIASLAVDPQGRWRGDLPDVDQGIYTLRVDEVAEDGSVTSRVETPFKREDPQVLSQAAAGEAGPLKRITVQKGNTLWGIASERYGDGLLYVKVFQANQSAIRDPDLIYPGQIFDLPKQ